MDPELYMDEMESALGSKIKDRRAFMTAFRGLVSSCEDDSDTDDNDKESSVSVASVLGKGKLK